MVCPFCLHKKTGVYNSRSTKRLNAVWRRRRCPNCKREFTTRESADAQSVLRVGTQKRSVAYNRAQLLLSVLKVCDHRADHGEAAYWLCDTIEQRLYHQAATSNNSVTKQAIVAATLETLKNFDTAAFVKYVSYHSPHMSKQELKKYLK